ncbi:MAG: hypothetical protein R2838_16310 [Caldilineaceae bacterium]
MATDRSGTAPEEEWQRLRRAFMALSDDLPPCATVEPALPPRP